MTSLQKGLVAHWTCNTGETDNDTLRDRTPHNTDLSLSNPSNITTGLSSPVGDAYGFDKSTTAQVRGPVSSGLENALQSNNYSIAFWIKPIDIDSSGTDWPNIFHVDSNNEQWRIEYDKNVIDTIALLWANANDGNLRAVDCKNIAVGAWNHLVFTVSSSGTSSTTSVYLNGELDSSNNTGDLDNFGNIGDWVTNRSDNVTHNISDVRVYNYPLPEQRVRELYNVRTIRRIRSPLKHKLLAHWTMNEEDWDNGVMRDRSGGGHHATATNSPIISTDSPIGESLDFDEPDVLDNTTLDVSLRTHTYSAWVKYDPNITGSSGNLGNSIIHSGGNLYEAAFMADWSSTDKQKYYRHPGDNPPDATIVSASINRDTWYHVVGRTGQNDHSIIIDGNSAESATPNNIDANIRHPQIAGSDQPEADSNFEGKISDLRLYGKPLTDTELDRLLNLRAQQAARV